MKNWKDQLLSFKSNLRESVSSTKEIDAPVKLDFEPPPIWLAAGQSTAKKPLDRSPIKKLTPPTTARASTTIPLAKPNVLPTPKFKPHINDGCTFSMPEWCVHGGSLQHPEHQAGRSPPMTVRLGVDFGTAFTKVAIRAGADLVPVDWSDLTGDDSEIGRYVVPGVVARSKDGEFCWRLLKTADVHGNLKLPVIESVGVENCPVATIAYLALVIRYARAFLYRDPEIGRRLPERSLRWELNIGCPTEPHDNPRVVEVLRRLARTAWLLAAEARLVEPDILAAWSIADSAVDLETDPGVVPEFVAQIAGYLRSPQVTGGLHALIDIGAATLDVATFNVVLSGDRASPPNIPIFFSAVRPLGTHYLRHNRYLKLGLELAWNDATPIESPDDFGLRSGKPSSAVIKVDEDFEGHVVRCILGVIDGTRTNSRGDPRSAAWREGLPIFVTGGGANCSLYRQAIKVAERQLISKLGGTLDAARNFRFIELNPASGNLRQTKAGGRLTVALGLTEDAENIARVVPHRDIKQMKYRTLARTDHTEIWGD